MESKDTEEIDDGYEPLTQEAIDELNNFVMRRYTEEELYALPEYRDSLFRSMDMIVEKWGKGEPVYERSLLSVLEVVPTEWIAETYFNRFKYLKWDDNENRCLFAEQIVLPYCIKKGILVKKKGAKDYEFVDAKAGRMQELNF